MSRETKNHSILSRQCKAEHVSTLVQRGGVKLLYSHQSRGRSRLQATTSTATFERSPFQAVHRVKSRLRDGGSHEALPPFQSLVVIGPGEHGVRAFLVNPKNIAKSRLSNWADNACLTAASTPTLTSHSRGR